MNLQDQLGGFAPYDLVFALPWWLTGVVVVVLCIGSVALAARVFHHRAWLRDEQYYSFWPGFTS